MMAVEAVTVEAPVEAPARTGDDVASTAVAAPAVTAPPPTAGVRRGGGDQEETSDDDGKDALHNGSPVGLRAKRSTGPVTGIDVDSCHLIYTRSRPSGFMSRTIGKR
jgi:hypothetical protein